MVIMFWVLLALAIVTLMMYVYIQMQYYIWDRQEREKNELSTVIAKTIEKSLADTQKGLTDSPDSGTIAESAAPTLAKGSNLSDGTGEIPCGGSKDIC